MKLSKHAKTRMQQRGIPRLVVDWLAAYGEVDHQRGASHVVDFSELSRAATTTRFVGRR